MKGWIATHPDLWQASAPLLAVLARGDEREFILSWVDALEPDDAYRWDAGLQALAFVPGQDALERLQRASASPDPHIQGAAVSALQQRWAQDKVYAGHTDAYFAIFGRVLREGSAHAAYSAAQVLSDPYFAHLDPGRVLVDAYRGMSAPDDQEPMMAILESLGRIGSPEARAILAEAAGHPNVQLRRTAAAALSALGVPPAPERPAGAAEEAMPAPAKHRAVDWADLASLGRAPRLRLETERGTVVIRLLPEEAPFTVHAVARLAREGAYDGVPFHRVVPNFVVQGGDVAGGDGFGSPGFTLPSEFTRLGFGEGVVGMASAGKDTEGSQFFVTHSAQPHLDGAYTAFGWVEAGMDVVSRLMVGDRIVKATVGRGG
jgi:peptidylprolyl isomerase